MSDALELRAWRFLAQHRVGSLAVTHLQFIDGPQPTINTPSTDQHYEQASGETFGAAAIELALLLGMDVTCAADESREASPPNASGLGSSCAPTATRRSGANGKTSRRIETESEASTIDATGAEPNTATGPGRARRASQK
jgi:hypothetical protein